MKDIPFESLIGWNTEQAALETLFKAGFNPERALAEMDKSYAETGHWRDLFGRC